MRLADYIALEGVDVMPGSAFETEQRYAFIRSRVKNLQKQVALHEVVVADGVAAYFMEHYLGPDGDLTWNPVDNLPTVAPIYERYFVEFYNPGIKDTITTAGKIRMELDLPPLCGVYLETSRFETMDIKDAIKLAVQYPGSHWLMNAVVIARLSEKLPPMVLGVFTMGLREDGSMIAQSRAEDGAPSITTALGYPAFPGEARARMSEAEWQTWFENSVLAILLPCLLATCLMHAKNVTVKDEAPHPKLNKRYEQRHGVPMVTYKTLDIRPMVKVLRDEGQSESTGLSRALHACRAHFKDYRNGRGLFGKVHGLWWWDEQERGSIDQGVVVKDYRVHPGAG